MSSQVRKIRTDNSSKIVRMLRKLFFFLSYYRQPLWDTGISPPELKDIIASHNPGKALDLGCGTGTNVITLAQAGWRVTGVDFIPQAIRKAKKKARQASVKVDLRVEDVTRIGAVKDAFDLILDIGCFHAIPPGKHEKYRSNVERLLAPTGTYLLYVFFKEPDVIGPGITEKDIAFLSERLRLVDRKDSRERGSLPAAWLTFHKS